MTMSIGGVHRAQTQQRRQALCGVGIPEYRNGLTLPEDVRLCCAGKLHTTHVPWRRTTHSAKPGAIKRCVTETRRKMWEPLLVRCVAQVTRLVSNDAPSASDHCCQWLTVLLPKICRSHPFFRLASSRSSGSIRLSALALCMSATTLRPIASIPGRSFHSSLSPMTSILFFD